MENKPLVFLKYSCGCGFTTNFQNKAIEHTKSKKHNMVILGSISIVKG